MIYNKFAVLIIISFYFIPLSMLGMQIQPDSSSDDQSAVAALEQHNFLQCNNTIPAEELNKYKVPGRQIYTFGGAVNRVIRFVGKKVLNRQFSLENMPDDCLECIFEFVICSCTNMYAIDSLFVLSKRFERLRPGLEKIIDVRKEKITKHVRDKCIGIIEWSGLEEQDGLQAKQILKSHLSNQRDLSLLLLAFASIQKQDIFPAVIRMQIVEELLKYGADPNIKQGEKRVSALMHAASTGQGAIVALLLKHGADVKAIDAYGLKASSYADISKINTANLESQQIINSVEIYDILKRHENKAKKK